jgi:hypothetical protein
MSTSDFTTPGTCLDDVHNEEFNLYIDTLVNRIAALEATASVGGAVDVPSDRYSTLGQLIGGSTTAAGSVLPAMAGICVPNPTAVANNWVKITGTAAVVGDTVFVQYEGRRTATPTSPASRIDSAAGPGAPGTNVLAAGEIEIALSGPNSDLNRVSWFLLRKV